MIGATTGAAQKHCMEMLPHIQRILNYRFRYMDPASREEAIQERSALAWLNYLRCQQQGKNPGASPLAHYATLNVKGGRGLDGLERRFLQAKVIFVFGPGHVIFLREARARLQHG